ncbi:hypothetical protein [Ruania zhangjianzhongii]|uniref:hypothetical protein n=1 Tax=Ruania zhangjianzhongii TaxID=2603206 RepID=UPI0011C87020|nr:hypothetical protein [Ruania zhangjianzhongii]
MLETMAMMTADGPWHDMAGGPPFPFFLIPLLWFLLLAGIVLTVVLSRRRHEHRAGLRAGEAVLAERFARGKIEAADYAARLQVLRQR